MRTTTATALLISALLLLAASAPTAQAQVNEDSFKGLAAYKLGESRKPLREIEQAVAASMANPAQRSAIAARLAAVLSSDASYDARDFACRQLALCITPEQIPAVAKLLPDEKLSHSARFVLERMTDPAAAAALRDALGTLKARTLVGVINSVGARRDTQSVPALSKLTADGDAEVATAAIAALGKIAADDAVKTLRALLASPTPAAKAAATDALLEAAEQLARGPNKADAADVYQALASAQPAPVRVAALAGLSRLAPAKALPALIEAVKGTDAYVATAAWGLLREIQGKEATAALVAALPTLSPDRQPMMLDVLASRGDITARGAVLEAARSSDAAVREAALRALGSLGTAQDVPMLAALATATARSPERDAARDALGRLKDSAVDTAIADLAQKADAPAAARVDLVGFLGARQATAKIPVVQKLAAADAEETVRVAAIATLGQLAGAKEATSLVELLAAAKTDAERDAGVKAVGIVASRLPETDALVESISAAIAKSSGANKASLLSALARAGGDKALTILRNTMKDSDPAVKDAAVRALAQWSDVAAVNDLLAIVRGDDAKHRVLALRGLASLVQKLPAAQAAEAAKICKQMLEASNRPEDKRVALSALGSVKHASALALAQSLLGDEQLKDEAASAIIGVARLLGGNKEPAKSALQKVIDSKASDTVKKRAKELQTKGK